MWESEQTRERERDFSMEKYNNFNIANIYKWQEQSVEAREERIKVYDIDDDDDGTGWRIIDFLESAWEMGVSGWTLVEYFQF